MLFGGNNDGSFWRYEPDSGEYTFFETVIEGAPLTTNELRVGPDERVYVPTYLGPGSIARFDPDSRTVTADIEHGRGGTTTPWGSGCTIVAHPSDGLLYGLSDGALFAFDPVSHESQVLDEGHNLERLAVAGDGATVCRRRHPSVPDHGQQGVTAGAQGEQHQKSCCGRSSVSGSTSGTRIRVGATVRSWRGRRYPAIDRAKAWSGQRRTGAEPGVDAIDEQVQSLFEESIQVEFIV